MSLGTRSVRMRWGRSAAVSTAWTAGTASAAAASIERIVACACGLRTKQAESAPGSLTSSTKRPCPVSSAGSSSRLTGSPKCRAPIQALFRCFAVITGPSPGCPGCGAARRIPLAQPTHKSGAVLPLAAVAARPGHASLEYLVEPPLDPAGLLLDVVVVDRNDLERLEIGRALRRRDIDARRVAAVDREYLLRHVADHELREPFRGVRIWRAFEHRGVRRDDAHAVGRIERLDRVAFALEVGGVGIERADRDHALAALEHVGDLLVALHHHGVVRPELLV